MLSINILVHTRSIFRCCLRTAVAPSLRRGGEGGGDSKLGSLIHPVAQSAMLRTPQRNATDISSSRPPIIKQIYPTHPRTHARKHTREHAVNITHHTHLNFPQQQQKRPQSLFLPPPPLPHPTLTSTIPTVDLEHTLESTSSTDPASIPYLHSK